MDILIEKYDEIEEAFRVAISNLKCQQYNNMFLDNLKSMINEETRNVALLEIYENIKEINPKIVEIEGPDIYECIDQRIDWGGFGEDFNRRDILCFINCKFKIIFGNTEIKMIMNYADESESFGGVNQSDNAIIYFNGRQVDSRELNDNGPSDEEGEVFYDSYREFERGDLFNFEEYNQAICIVFDCYYKLILNSKKIIDFNEKLTIKNDERQKRLNY